MRKQHGFTLIEMLVATAIMLSVLLIASTAYGFFAERWRSNGDMFARNVANARAQMLISTVVNSTLPFLVPKENEVYYFFEGDNHRLSGITAAPIFSSGSAVYELIVVDVGDGTKQLLYREAPIKGERVEITGELPAFVYEKVILEDVSVMGFRFYGWQSKQAKHKHLDTENGSMVWQDEYRGEVNGYLPYAVALTLDQAVLRFYIPSDEGYSQSLSSDRWEEA